MTVVITGATGVVGGAVLRHLLADGRSVRAVSRGEEGDRVLIAAGATPVRADVTEPGSLAAAFDGAQVVYHVAGLNTMCPDDPAELDRVNVDGSVAVVEAAEAAGVRRLVYTSSAATIGEPAGTVGSETSPHRGSYLSHYEASKHRAESAVFATARTVEVVSVNPSSVQGPGRATGTGKLILDVLRGRLPVLIDTRVSIVGIDDCARGHLLAEQHAPPGARYVLNSFTLTMREAVDVLAEVTGSRASVRWIPGWMATAAVAPVEVMARLLGRKPSFCREMVRTLRHGHAYDGTRAAAELGLTYTPAETLLRELVEWYRAEGLL